MLPTARFRVTSLQVVARHCGLASQRVRARNSMAWLPESVMVVCSFLRLEVAESFLLLADDLDRACPGGKRHKTKPHPARLPSAAREE
jgi:hypothetical protein